MKFISACKRMVGAFGLTKLTIGSGAIKKSQLIVNSNGSLFNIKFRYRLLSSQKNVSEKLAQDLKQTPTEWFDKLVKKNDQQNKEIGDLLRVYPKSKTILREKYGISLE